MYRSLLKILCSNSLVILAIACSPLRGYHCVETDAADKSHIWPMVDPGHSLLYQASIDIYNKHYSGLIILKQLDTANIRLTFVTEIGMKLFDFEVRDTLIPVYIFAPLNKPPIVEILKKDLRLILLQQLIHQPALLYQKQGNNTYTVSNAGKRYYYQLYPGTNKVKKLTVKKRLFTKEWVKYQYADTADPSLIKLKHKGLLRLRMTWTHINRQP